LCALCRVTRAGYYAWARRRPSGHAEQDRRLLRTIERLFQAHGGAYGSPRLVRALRAAGFATSRRRVMRLMRQAGLRARAARIYRANPRLHQFFSQHPNRIRRLVVQHPNRVWVGDVTYIAVAGRWRFLAVVMDQFSRRILAWALSARRSTQLTRTVLDAAVRRRGVSHRLIFHSDRGTEYSGSSFRDRLRQLGVAQSSALHGPGENAHMESFFHSLKAEILHGTAFTSDAALRSALRGYFQYYNAHRLHSALGYRAPIDYESLAA
jgi:putative transposase